MYLNRIHTVTFLPFRTYNTDSGNATIQVLSLDGKLLDSTNATDGIATLNAQPGEVVIVKVGTESYKVVVR